ncbi:MAG: ImmA/IrrE family metallo-endopeptidase [Pirellulales bacterium]
MAVALDLIELDGKATPDALATEIIRQNPDVPVPVPIEEIATKAGILKIQPLRSEAFEGMLIANAEKSEGVIFVNQDRPRQRQRFTIGHELGHFLLPWHRAIKDGSLTFECTAEDMQASRSGKLDARTNWEVQANEFSSEILMPRAPFKKNMKRKDEPDLEHVRDLASLFDTSVEATARRYVALSDYPIAMVFAKGKQVRHAWKGPEFLYFLDVKKGSQLPKGSASLADAKEDFISEATSVESYWWINGDKGRRPPDYILEQTLYQRDGYRVTILFVEPEEKD